MFFWSIKQQDSWFKTASSSEASNYAAFKDAVLQQQQFWQKTWKNNPQQRAVHLNSVEDYIQHSLVDSVFAYWYGTPWDFNGTTRIPKQGQIACGYFVTTTLEDMGFKLERRLLAQQAASVIIKTLCKKKSIRVFAKIKTLKNYFDTQNDGIYILGLDTHVGFLIKSTEGLHIVHSSYSGHKQVRKEAWNQSKVMSTSKLFMVGSITGNTALFQQWINGQIIALRR